MFLRSLSLRGFKSFANKSVLKFEEGIAAIVGPNGSGKSNITDAALWVLGEQKAKTLRGSTMQDVIFSGSTTRQSLGVAEVSIVLDNTGGLIPIEYGEVTILRRCYRSGESEYYLNGSPCRLIDIQEILSDSGMGREMYSIISQGKLDEVLNSRPEERRRLIEEAAGILKHKKRKERALRKLNSMEDNLTRARDILKELNRRLSPLEKQARAAVIYNALADELKEAETAVAVIELRRFQNRWELQNEKVENLKQELEELGQRLRAEESVIETCEDQLESLETVFGDLGEYRRRTEGIKQQINSGLLFLEEKGRNLIERLSDLRQKRYQDNSRLQSDQKEMGRIEKEKLEADKELTELYSELSVLRKKAEQVKKESAKIGERYNAAAKELESGRSELDKVRSEAGLSASASASVKNQIDFFIKRKAEIRQRYRELEKEKQSTSSEMRNLEGEIGIESSSLDSVNAELNELTTELDDSNAKLTEEIKKSDAVNARIKALSSVIDDLTPNRPTDLFTENNIDDGIIGRINDYISVEKKYETAIEAVLDQDIYALIAKDYPTIFRSVNSLTPKGERQSFVPVAGSITARHTPEIAGAKAAVEVVMCDKKIKPALELLLQNIYIVEDLRPEYQKMIKSAGCVFVSLNGDVIDYHGVVRWGRSKKEEIGLISCKRELGELKNDLVNLNADANDIKVTINDLKEKYLKKIEAKERIENGLREKELTLEKTGSRIAAAEDQMKVLENDTEDLEKAIDQAKASLTRHDEVAGKHSGEAAGLVGRVEAAEKELDKLGSERDGQTEKERNISRELGECQIKMASLTERQVFLKKQLLKLTGEINGIKYSLDSGKNIEEALERLRSRIEPVHALYTSLRLKTEKWADYLKNKADAELAESKDVREKLKEAQEKTRTIHGKVNDLKENETRLQVSQAQIEVQVNATIEKLVDELRIPLEAALKTVAQDIDINEAEKKAKRLRSELTDLGTVNPMAAEEYREISERHDFLSKQMDDLIKSKRALEKVVTAIDKKISEKFAKTLAEVNGNFKKVFAELFPGGSVELISTEGDDISEAGLEIEAQPHGKRLQSLQLLSGGEKSLVGLAFLFAIYHTRPSPFYILDEVEAALDVVNLQRFINLLIKLKNETQFLIITHQRMTMEIADTLYGVTMQADGVSQIMSQKLSDIDKKEGNDGEKELAETAEVRS